MAKECERRLNALSLDSNSGTPYNVEAATAFNFNGMPVFFKHSSLHRSEAVRQLREANDPCRPLSKAQISALDRLQKLGQRSHWGADILLKVFHDIDTLLFHGALKENSTVRWMVDPFQLIGGHTTEKKREISLNIVHVASSRTSIHEAISLLIHEGVHAYLSLFCGRVLCMEKMRPNFHKHGEIFIDAMEAVQLRLGPTRYCHLKVHGGEPGGEVLVGSPLYEQWERKAGFRLDGEEPLGSKQSVMTLRSKRVSSEKKSTYSSTSTRVPQTTTNQPKAPRGIRSPTIHSKPFQGEAAGGYNGAFRHIEIDLCMEGNLTQAASKHTSQQRYTEGSGQGCLVDPRYSSKDRTAGEFRPGRRHRG